MYVGLSIKPGAGSDFFGRRFFQFQTADSGNWVMRLFLDTFRRVTAASAPSMPIVGASQTGLCCCSCLYVLSFLAAASPRAAVSVRCRSSGDTTATPTYTSASAAQCAAALPLHVHVHVRARVPCALTGQRLLLGSSDPGRGRGFMPVSLALALLRQQYPVCPRAADPRWRVRYAVRAVRVVAPSE